MTSFTYTFLNLVLDLSIYEKALQLIMCK